MVKNKIQNQLVLEINDKSLDWKVSEIFQEVKNITKDLSRLEQEVSVLQDKNDDRYLAIDKKIDDSDNKTKLAFESMSTEVQAVKIKGIINKSDITRIIGIGIGIGTIIAGLVSSWISSKFK